MLLPVRVHVQAHFYSTNQANIKQILWSTKGQEKAQDKPGTVEAHGLLILRLHAYIIKLLIGMG